MNVRINSPRMLTMLSVAAIVAVCFSGHAHAAEAFDEMMQSASGHILSGWQYGLNMVGFIGGSGMLIGSLVMIYLKHNGKGGQQIGYGAIVSTALVGTLLIGFTIYEGVLSQTFLGQKSSITGAQQKITFDQ
ncbi:hypothetical protein [Acetobacter papayae]|uniref:hypothetical protein n=1 Tax=Acetobacter papayae TaxID=1076592 RepID=UPI00046FC276|nr:hypothetical protein [Acetobacter papayae]